MTTLTRVSDAPGFVFVALTDGATGDFFEFVSLESAEKFAAIMGWAFVRG